MAVRQPVALNAQGDYCCPGCGKPVEVGEGPGRVRDISGRDVDAVVASMGIDHDDACTVIAELRRG